VGPVFVVMLARAADRNPRTSVSDVGRLRTSRVYI
jgi:hypothetical protein